MVTAICGRLRHASVMLCVPLPPENSTTLSFERRGSPVAETFAGLAIGITVALSRLWLVGGEMALQVLRIGARVHADGFCLRHNRERHESSGLCVQHWKNWQKIEFAGLPPDAVGRFEQPR